MSNAHLAYYDAEFADALYAKTIRDVAGEKAACWRETARQMLNSEVDAAWLMKLNADNAWLDLLRADLVQRTIAKREGAK